MQSGLVERDTYNVSVRGDWWGERKTGGRCAYYEISALRGGYTNATSTQPRRTNRIPFTCGERTMPQVERRYSIFHMTLKRLQSFTRVLHDATHQSPPYRPRFLHPYGTLLVSYFSTAVNALPHRLQLTTFVPDREHRPPPKTGHRPWRGIPPGRVANYEAFEGAPRPARHA